MRIKFISQYSTYYGYATLTHKWVLALITFLSFANLIFSQEICNDGIDNDQDGFIDFYDENCLCDHSIFNAQCKNTCISLIDTTLRLKLKWKSRVYNNTDQIVLSNICADHNDNIYVKTLNLYGSNRVNEIVVFSSIDGTVLNTISLDTTTSTFSNELATYSLNSSNTGVIARTNSDYIYNTDQSGNLIWKISDNETGFSRFRFIKLADFNQDGEGEIYSGSHVSSLSTGNLLAKGNSSEGCNFSSGSTLCNRGANSIAGDFTSHQGLELACGNVLYEIDFNNIIDSAGNTINIITAPTVVKEGFTAMGDFDMDGNLDIVSSRSNGLNDGGIWIWNPRNQSVIASVDFANGPIERGGVPVVCDLDNDCFPEIIVIYRRELRVYSYDGTSTLKLLYDLPDQDNSGFTSPAIFDLNRDGTQEIISRDEDYIYILDGPTGSILDTFPIMSITASEQPIITDTDNDGHAEILIHGSDDHPDSLRLFCFESDNIPWAPARKVWNQSGYHVTNVNDDLTIPQYQQNSAAFFDTDSCYNETCPQVYNNFGVQATYRTQKGCIVFPEDTTMRIEIVGDTAVLCPGDSNTYFVDPTFSNIYWTSDGQLSCVDCATVEVSSDTSVWLTVETIDEQCSSIDSFFIAVRPLVAFEDTMRICFGDSVVFFGQVLKETGFYQYDINDCDSIATLDLFVDDQITEDFMIDVCDQDSVVINEVVLNESGVYEISLETLNGCDSLLIIDLEFLHSSTYEDTVFVCEGDSIMIQNEWYFGNEIVSLVEENSVGCDSLIELFIDEVDILLDSTQIAFCEGDSVLIDNIWIKESGNYPIELVSESGCDSIFTIEVTVFMTRTDSIDREICNGDTLIIEDVPLFDAGIHEVFTASSIGCDSIITVDLSILENMDSIVYDSVCPLDSIFIIDEWISSAGEYTFELLAENGCDSLVTFDIEEIPIDIDTMNLTLCQGDSILINGVWIKNAGNYFDTVATANCQSIDLSIVDLIFQLEDSSILTLCQGDTLLIENQVIVDSGEYPVLFESVAGCDSIHTYIVSKTILPEAPLISFDCDQELYETSVQANEDWIVDWSNGENGNVALYSDSGEATVLLQSNENCSIEYSFLIPTISTLNNFVPITDQTIRSGESLQVFLELDTSLWSVFWNPSDVVSCDTCLTTTINVEQETNVNYTLTNSEGCSEELGFLISVDENNEIFFPNVFSPNGDNINDELFIDLSDFPINEFSVYDRWGALIFRSNNQAEITWDGTLNNRHVVNGVYVYTLRYNDKNGTSKLKVGDLTVLK